MSNELNTRKLIGGLEQRQALIVKLVGDTAVDLVRFYLPSEHSFSRSVSWLSEPPRRSSSTSSITAAGAVLNASQKLPKIFGDGRLERIKVLCRDTIGRVLDPGQIYWAVSSESFGDLNPLTAAISLKHLLKFAPDGPPPAILRLSLRIVLGYLLTQLSFDVVRIRKVFGSRSLWALLENHPMLLFKGIDALVELLEFISIKRPGAPWIKACFSPISSAEMRTIRRLAPSGARADLLRRLHWLNEEALRPLDSLGLRRLPNNEARAEELLRSVFDYFVSTARVFLDMERGKHARKARSDFDASSLAALVAILALSSPGVTQLEVLGDFRLVFDELSADGTWPSGRPFFFDELDRARHAPSIEVAYLALRGIAAVDRPQARLAMGRLYDALHERFEAIYSWIVGSRRTLTVGPDVSLYDPDGGSPSQCRGWVSDRSSDLTRIDCWVTATVLEFICDDYSLRKGYIQRLVLSRYEVTPYELCTPRWERLVDPDSGMRGSVKCKLQAKVLKKSGGQACVSLLLYGPPGTSKTTIARAIAHSRRADLIRFNAGDFVQDGFEMLENRARQIFQDLSRLENVVVLFDEMDPLIRSRQTRLKDTGTSIVDYVIPGMLPKLQDFHDYCVEANVVFVITTNFRDIVDPSVSRTGRVDLECLVLPYGRRARVEQLREFLRKSVGHAVAQARWRRLVEQLAEGAALMVYRDLEGLALAVEQEYRDGRTPGHILDGAAVRKALKVRTIRLEEYAFGRRPAAGYELVSVLHRLLNRSSPKEGSLEDSTALLRAFRRVQRHLQEAVDPGPSDVRKRAIRIVHEWCLGLQSARGA